MNRTKTGQQNNSFGFQLTPPDMQQWLLAAPRMQAAGMRALLNHQREIMSFYKRRCDQDLHLFEQISGAEEFKTIWAALLGFWESAGREYTAEAGKIAELGSQVAHETIQTIQREAAPFVERSEAQMAA